MASHPPRPEVWLVRHGETEWSAAGRHSGWTDLTLTDIGEAQARALEPRLRGTAFSDVLTSPLRRAADTARLAGYKAAVPMDDLREWNYGQDEGRTTDEIRLERPGWTVWRDGPQDGETVNQVGARADRVLSRVRMSDGPVLIFAHAHLLRILAARWLGLPPADGRRFVLGAAAVSLLGWERETPAILSWNQR